MDGFDCGYPVFIWESSFRIKKKADVEKFLSMKGQFHWEDDATDYWMSDGEVSSRPIFARDSIFNPSFVEQNPAEVIWNTRKYINKKLAGK